MNTDINTDKEADNAWVKHKPNQRLPRPSKSSVKPTSSKKRLCRQMGQAISDFNLIEAGDRIMVCMSGGKDSYGMLDILLKMKARAPGGL